MQTILKSFRLPADCAEFIERKAKEEEVPQSQVVVDALKSKMDFWAQWQRDLQVMAEDEEYRKEQLELAEENYD